MLVLLSNGRWPYLKMWNSGEMLHRMMQELNVKLISGSMKPSPVVVLQSWSDERLEAASIPPIPASNLGLPI